MVFSAVVWIWKCKNIYTVQLRGASPRRGVWVFDHLLSSRNNSLIFWPETYHNPSVPCQWGTVFGLRTQQEVNDEPVGSSLKCSGEPGSECRHLRTTFISGFPEAQDQCGNTLILWEFCFVFPSSALNPKLYGRSPILHHTFLLIMVLK